MSTRNTHKIQQIHIRVQQIHIGLQDCEDGFEPTGYIKLANS